VWKLRVVKRTLEMCCVNRVATMLIEINESRSYLYVVLSNVDDVIEFARRIFTYLYIKKNLELAVSWNL